MKSSIKLIHPSLNELISHLVNDETAPAVRNDAYHRVCRKMGDYFTPNQLKELNEQVHKFVSSKQQDPSETFDEIAHPSPSSAVPQNLIDLTEFIRQNYLPHI